MLQPENFCRVAGIIIYMEQFIEVGKTYRHYKGNVYVIIAFARHSETGEDMIVYQSVKNGDVWVRPRYMWNEEVELNGTRVLRFTQI